MKLVSPGWFVVEVLVPSAPGGLLLSVRFFLVLVFLAWLLFAMLMARGLERSRSQSESLVFYRVERLVKRGSVPPL